jgi:nucleotide-binding universal stress UspA family protein
LKRPGSDIKFEKKGMKTIFAATDFTEGAYNACVYAASLAREFNARLVLFSACEPVPFPVTEAPLEYGGEDMKAPTELNLKNTTQSLQLSHGEIVIETMCREGIIINEILSAAKEIKADIIIAGMKERGRGFRKVFGSTITALARKSELPIIVVPESAPFCRLNTLALGNDHDIDPETDINLLDMLIELGKRFSSKLYLVRIVKNRYHESHEVFNRPLRLIKMARPLEPLYICFEGRNEEKALNEFVRKYKVDMLVLLPHYHSMADRLFSISTTRTMIFDSQIPLLILPGLRMQEHE